MTAGSVGVAVDPSTVAGDHDVAVGQAYPRVCARPPVAVAVVTGEPDERAGQGETVPLGDTTREPNVLPGAVDCAVPRGPFGEGVQSLDTLFGDHGSRPSRATAVDRSGTEAGRRDDRGLTGVSDGPWPSAA